MGGAYLAYLCAWTTAYGGASFLDESIHIAFAFQLAGVANVIATRWPVPDRSATRPTHLIYDNLLAAAAPAFAVHQAVRAASQRNPNHPGLWAAHVHLGP